jgi:lysophospholipase L1-like esterase
MRIHQLIITTVLILVLLGLQHTEIPAQELGGYYYTLVRQHQRMDGNVPADALIFIGDSILQGLAVAAVADRSVNFGISGDTTAGVIKRLPIYRSVERARAIVLHVGVNDLAYRTPEELLANFHSILTDLPGSRPIVVSAILPLDENVLNYSSGNREIKEINARLASLCREFDRAIYVDAGLRLADTEGNLERKYHVGDGVHLSNQGYDVLIDVYRSAITRF